MVQVPEDEVDRVVGVLRVAAGEPGRVARRHRHHHQRPCERKHEARQREKKTKKGKFAMKIYILSHMENTYHKSVAG